MHGLLVTDEAIHCYHDNKNNEVLSINFKAALKQVPVILQ